MIEIIDFSNSTKPNKRYRITLREGDTEKSWDFGAKHGHTFIDHADPVKRYNYWRRHLANPVERERIQNNIPSNALFSAKLLWGDSADLIENLTQLNMLLNRK